MNKLMRKAALISSLCVYFTMVFSMTAHAYIDPSVTTYLIQAVAGIVIAKRRRK